MREHKRTPKKRKSGGGTRNKRYSGGAPPVGPPAEGSPVGENVALVENVAREEGSPVGETVGNRRPIVENIAPIEPLDTQSVQGSQGSYIPKKLQDTIVLYIEKDATVNVNFGGKTYIKFIKCINSNALDKLSKIMYSTLLNKDSEEVHLLIRDSLCLYKEKKSDIENWVIGNLRNLEEDVNDLKNNIDNYSRDKNDVTIFHKDIMGIDDKYFGDDNEDFKGMFVNIRNEFDNGIIGFRGNEISRKIFEKEEKNMKGRSQFELNKFYLFNIIDFMIFMGIKVREELEEYLEAINQLVQFNNDIVKLQKNIKKGEEEANKKEEVMMTLRELFKDEENSKLKRQKEFISEKVVNQMNGSSVLVDLKSLMDEKRERENGGDSKEITRIDAEIGVKKAELMKEITKFKLEDNDNITSQLEKGIEGMNVSKVEDLKDKEEAKTVKLLLQELVNEKKKLEQISRTQRGGAAQAQAQAQALPASGDAEIQQINENIKKINNELENMKKKREKYMKEKDDNWTWRDDPLFMYYYYTSMGNALGDILNYQIEFWSNLKRSVEGSLSNLSNINIEGFFVGIVNEVGSGIENGLTEAAIASQEVITEFLSGGVEVLGVMVSTGADIIGGDIVGGLGSIVGALGEFASAISIF